MFTIIMVSVDVKHQVHLLNCRRRRLCSAAGGEQERLGRQGAAGRDVLDGRGLGVSGRC